MRQQLTTLILLWAAWLVTLIAFQNVVTARLEPQRPDTVLNWTTSETGPTSHHDKPYLTEPFMNEQVAWDSEFYLSIALRGYDDPNVRTATPVNEDGSPGQEPVSLNYAFYPMYPWVIRIVSYPLRLVTPTPVASLTLAGVLVSALGALAAMIALFDIVRLREGDDSATRAAFYMLIFPTGFFLAMVYTEGLFMGLAFTSLALMQRKHLAWAGILAAFAVWTRAVGIALIFPLAIAWWQSVDWSDRERLLPIAARGLLVLIPVAAFGIWWLIFHEPFKHVEDSFFGRSALAIEESLAGWHGAFSSMSLASDRLVYYALEFAAVILGITACLVTLRPYPGLSLFGLAVIVISFTSGVPQGMPRYVMVAPSVYIMLALLGRNKIFDRAWSLASALGLGLLSSLFAFDFWVG